MKSAGLPEPPTGPGSGVKKSNWVLSRTPSDADSPRRARTPRRDPADTVWRRGYPDDESPAREAPNAPASVAPRRVPRCAGRSHDHQESPRVGLEPEGDDQEVVRSVAAGRVTRFLSVSMKSTLS